MTSRNELQKMSTNASNADTNVRFKERYANFVDEALEIRDELMSRLERAVEMATQNGRLSCSVLLPPQRWSFPVQMLLYGPSKRRNPRHLIGEEFLRALNVATIADVIHKEFCDVTIIYRGPRVIISWAGPDAADEEFH